MHWCEHILVMMDHFTCFTQVYCMQQKKVVEKVFNHFALKFGFPARIHPDMGRELKNLMFPQLQKVCGMRVPTLLWDWSYGT